MVDGEEVRPQTIYAAILSYFEHWRIMKWIAASAKSWPLPLCQDKIGLCGVISYMYLFLGIRNDGTY